VVKEGIDIYGCDCDLEQRVQSKFFNEVNKNFLQVFLNMKKILTCPTEEKEKFEKRLFQNFQEVLYVQMDDCEEKLDKLLPDRVDSILKTLEETSQRAERVFLIVDNFFFETDCKEKSTLCDTLKKRSVVVLTPKDPSFSEYSIKKEDLLMKLQKECSKFFNDTSFDQNSFGKWIEDERARERIRMYLAVLQRSSCTIQ
jgi:hypothetical protein